MDVPTNPPSRAAPEGRQQQAELSELLVQLGQTNALLIEIKRVLTEISELQLIMVTYGRADP